MAILKKLAKKIWLQHIEPRLLAAPLTVQLTQNALHSMEKGVTGGAEFIVSLTTYGKRIHEVYLPIESLLQQTFKADKIILWLSKDEFNENNIPIILKKQRERGLEIAYCKDLRSYTKLVPALETHPNAIIVTVDDDRIYPFDLLENLMRGHKENANTVICYRCHKFTFSDNKLNSYNKWLMDYQGEELCIDTLPTGVGGVLYPSKCFHEDVAKKDLFRKLSPTADDLWFKTMTLLNNIPCKKISFGMRKATPLYNNQDTALMHINVAGKQNDVQIKQVFDYYNIPLSYSGIKNFQNL